MKPLKDILHMFAYYPKRDVEEITQKLPGKDCGLCGVKTCREFAALVVEKPDVLGKCIFMGKSGEPGDAWAHEKGEITWKDMLDREYDFILEKFPDEPGPRETILPFNPSNVEKLKIKKDDIVYGRPAFAGCPVTHCGVVVAEPDYFNGTIEWCIVGPLAARENGTNIGHYTPIAYEGLVIHSRKELQYGMRYHFLPRYCMLQMRHSGVLNVLVKTAHGLHARMEGVILD